MPKQFHETGIMEEKEEDVVENLSVPNLSKVEKFLETCIMTVDEVFESFKMFQIAGINYDW